MPTKDPQGFLSDPQIRGFKRARRADLLAADTPLFSDGRFIIYQNRTQDGQVEVVK